MTHAHRKALVCALYLSVAVSDGQAEHAVHLAAVGEFEASVCRPPDQDFVEDELVVVQDVNPFGVAELFGGELLAAGAQVMLLEDGGHVQRYG